MDFHVSRVRGLIGDVLQLHLTYEEILMFETMLELSFARNGEGCYDFMIGVSFVG